MDQKSVSEYMYVTKRVLRGQTYWMGQPRRNSQKIFKTQLEAAKFVAKVRCVSVNKLLKTKDKLFTGGTYCDRFKAILKVYSNGREGPGDLESWRQLSKVSKVKQLFNREPAAELLSLLVKYDPFRKAFHKALAGRSTVGRSKVARAEALRNALRKAAVATAANHDLSVWVRNCGRNVSHHSGLIAVLHRFHILQRATRKKNGCLKFTEKGNVYTLKNTPAARKACIAKLQHVISFMDDVKCSAVQGPRTCTQWCDAYDCLLEVARKHCAVPNGQVVVNTSDREAWIGRPRAGSLQLLPPSACAYLRWTTIRLSGQCEGCSCGGCTRPASGI